MYDLSYIGAVRQHLNPTSSKEEQIQSALSELATIEPYTARHSYRVGVIAGRIAEELSLDPKMIKRVTLGGMLHDIGKSGVSLSALCKPSKLSDDEFKDIMKHPELGASLIQSSPKLLDLIPAVLYHHERFDGQGYPFGLSGEEIPIEARVIAVADSYDAMTSDRVYRKALTHEFAVEELSRCAGVQFDPDVVEGALTADLDRLPR